jgi:cytochrome P450
MYDDPEAFRPERFLDDTGNLNGLEEPTVFGYGRRYACLFHKLNVRV